MWPFASQLHSFSHNKTDVVPLKEDSTSCNSTNTTVGTSSDFFHKLQLGKIPGWKPDAATANKKWKGRCGDKTIIHSTHENISVFVKLVKGKEIRCPPGSAQEERQAYLMINKWEKENKDISQRHFPELYNEEPFNRFNDIVATRFTPNDNTLYEWWKTVSKASTSLRDALDMIRQLDDMAQTMQAAGVTLTRDWHGSNILVDTKAPSNTTWLWRIDIGTKKIIGRTFVEFRLFQALCILAQTTGTTQDGVIEMKQLIDHAIQDPEHRPDIQIRTHLQTKEIEKKLHQLNNMWHIYNDLCDKRDSLGARIGLKLDETTFKLQADSFLEEQLWVVVAADMARTQMGGCFL